MVLVVSRSPSRDATRLLRAATSSLRLSISKLLFEEVRGVALAPLPLEGELALTALQAGPHAQQMQQWLV